MGGGVGVSREEGVKGGWLVNTFLLLLTGWQAVLLPWAPLILRSAGFTPTGVGVVTCLGCVGGSVGVIVSLRWVRRTRSGGVRRLLLLVSLAAAVLLQVSSVVLLQGAGSGGANPACAVLSPLTPPPSSPLSHSPASSTTHAQGLNTTGPLVSFSPPSPPVVSPPPVPTTSPATHSTIMLTPSTTMLTPSTTTTTTTTTKTTTTTTKEAAAAVITTITTPPITSTSSTTEASPELSSVLAPGVFTLGGQVNNGDGWRSDKVKTPPSRGSSVETSHQVPGTGQGHHHPSHARPAPPRPAPPHAAHTLHHATPEPEEPHHGPKLRPDDEWSDTSGDEDDYEDETGEENESGEENQNDKHYGEGDLTSLLGPVPHNDGFSSLGENSRDNSYKPSDGSSSRVSSQEGDPWRDENWVHHMPGPVRSHAPELKHRMKSPPVLSAGGSQIVRQNVPFGSTRRKPYAESYPNVLSKLHHQAAQPPQKPGINWWELESRPLSWQDSPAAPPNNYHPSGHHGGSRLGTRLGGLKRGRRSPISPTSLRTERADPDESSSDGGSNTTVQRSRNDDQVSHQLLVKGGSVGVAVGVALLLVLGSVVGSGVESDMAQLWHCYTHGYDEDGVSQDVLQRTVTHTFHLCVYASHKTWSGITSGAWVLGAGVVSILSCLVGMEMGVYGSLAGIHLTLGIVAILVLLILPVPYGSIDPPRTRRPLSLYLDDEVLREGVRRLTFHSWVWSSGALAALSLTFSLWLVQERLPQGWVVGGQAGAVGVTLVAESLTLHVYHRFITRLGLFGVMGVASLALTFHYGFMWAAAGSVGAVVLAHAGLGLAMALLWVAVKHNSLLLATVSDQEREAWASWWCWRAGVGVGAVVWGVGVTGAGGLVGPLLLLVTLLAGMLASTVGLAAIVSRHDSRTRRRVFHTLDLGMGEDGDDDDDDAEEDDWLVKRARKEGMKL